MASNQFRFNHQSYSQHELELACSLGICLGKSDETIGTILGARRYGIGGPHIPCAGLVAFLRQSSHAAYRRVSNNRAYWGPEAQQVYQDWMGSVSQMVQRYGASFLLEML